MLSTDISGTLQGETWKWGTRPVWVDVSDTQNMCMHTCILELDSRRRCARRKSFPAAKRPRHDLTIALPDLALVGLLGFAPARRAQPLVHFFVQRRHIPDGMSPS